MSRAEEISEKDMKGKPRLYRRHTIDCPHLKEGRQWTLCSCPISFDAPHPVSGKRVREALDTSNWKEALVAAGNRIALLALDAEKPQAKGATVVDGLFAIATAINRLAGVIERTDWPLQDSKSIS